MNSEFSWEQSFDSICDAPIKAVEPCEVDDDHPAKKFLSYWLGLNGTKVPDYAQVEIPKVKYILKWMMLFSHQVFGSQTDYQLSLIGIAASKMAIHARQGQFLQEFTRKDCYTSRRSLMDTILEDKEPAFARINISEKSEFRTDAIVGLFPFKSVDGLKILALPAPNDIAMRELL